MGSTSRIQDNSAQVLSPPEAIVSENQMGIPVNVVTGMVLKSKDENFLNDSEESSSSVSINETLKNIIYKFRNIKVLKKIMKYSRFSFI